jgi:hypothetical protein
VSDFKGKVRLADVLAVIRELVQLHLARHGSIPDVIVAVGGTALAAHRVRSASYDVDLYLSEVDDDIVPKLNETGRKKFGTQFKLDVTSGRVRDARTAIVLERAIEQAADTIRPNPDRPAQLIFDVIAGGASEQVRAIAASRPDLVTTVAARIIKNIAPDRFKEMDARARQCRRIR